MRTRIKETRWMNSGRLVVFDDYVVQKNGAVVFCSLYSNRESYILKIDSMLKERGMLCFIAYGDSEWYFSELIDIYSPSHTSKPESNI